MIQAIDKPDVGIETAFSQSLPLAMDIGQRNILLPGDAPDGGGVPCEHPGILRFHNAIGNGQVIRVNAGTRLARHERRGQHQHG